MQLRIQMPRASQPVEMMARAARRVHPDLALTAGRMPGIGFQFYCVSSQVLSSWEQLVREAVDYLEIRPDINPFALRRALEQANRPASLEAVDDAAKRQENRTNLLFRASDLDRLEQFIQEELAVGTFSLQLPYPIEDGSPVNLRVIHPRSEEEFLLFGHLHHQERDGCQVRFSERHAALIQAFRRFVTSGEVPAAYGGSRG